MPTARNGDVDLYYETAGTASGAARETVAFCPEAGVGAWLWGWQAPALAGPYETLVWDPRGTGRSDAPPGPYDAATLASDLDAVLADAGARRAHLVGCGLGGMIALAHARQYGRARSLVLLNTAASGDSVDCAALVRLFGPDWAAVAFSDDYREVADLDAIEGWRDEDDAGAAARDAQFDAVAEFDSGPLYEHETPALVLSALEDPVVPASAGESLAEGLPHGEFETVAGRHLAFVEHSVAVTDAVTAFLEELE